ncbi:MAG: hypothetical protein L0L28_04885 [Corynebacterium flavescens]|uniref:phage terminase small subunit n=1 Tax=Corynebacterium flavescens TaxID=28028 RepID=UPI002649859B|nr:hypothetical protein [Corynebacterium flavescens]MDN6552092.1 hypothetical protein [Corynebacterium flavescens]
MPARRKRIDQKVRHRPEDRPADAGGTVVSLPVRGVVKVPPARRHWHAVARDWYRSLNQSGQVGLFEPSDWAAAQLVAEQLSSLMKEAEESGLPIRPTAFESIWTAMGDLLSTEASRRKVRVELQRAAVSDPDANEVSEIMAGYKKLLEGPPVS